MNTTTQVKTIGVLLVDDHMVLRYGLKILLNQQPNIHVMGEAETGEEAIHAALRLQPTLILLDLLLPDTSPTHLLSEIRRVSPKSKILILSGVEEAEQVYEVVDAGIDGYALKHMEMQDLIHAIEEVASGNAYLHPSITRLVLFRAARAFSPTPKLENEPELAILTPRETQVLRLMASTATNRDIAERLVISEETIRSHVKSIFKKLTVNTRTQAVLEAVRLGIISVAHPPNG